GVRRKTMLTRTRLILIAFLAAVVAGLVFYPRLEAATPPDAGTAKQTDARQAGGGTAGAREPGGGGAAGPVAVVTAVAAKEDVPVTADAVGFVEPIATVAVRPRMDGLIVEQKVQEGALVK